MKTIYLDAAATTQMRTEVIEKMTLAMQTYYGNPSSTHSAGRSAKAAVETARKNIAKKLNVQGSEIIFTSGGTEANNMILNSCVRDLGVTRIISSEIEHHAVLNTIKQLKKQYPIKVDYVNLKEGGALDLEHLELKLQESNEKTLVSLMYINNEIGNILNLKETSEICKKYNAFFHSDTVQAIGHYELNLKEVPVDFITASAHKFHGPKGVGFVFLRKNSSIRPLLFGGEQERGVRAGTEAVPAIIGLEQAFLTSYINLQEEKAYISNLKAYFVQNLKTAIPDIKFNGQSEDQEKSTYTIVNVNLPVTQDAKMLLFQLDMKGIACSRGSACQSGADKGSHVLEAFLSEDDLNRPSIRFSLSKYNTKEELDYVVAVLKEYCLV